METEKYTNTIHLGRKIERVRRLRGMTQAELGDLLGITKQAVSKIEQTEKFDDERLGEIASALGVTVDGLKNFNEETRQSCIILITSTRIAVLKVLSAIQAIIRPLIVSLLNR